MENTSIAYLMVAVAIPILAYLASVRVYALREATGLGALVFSPPLKRITLALLRRYAQKSELGWKAVLDAYDRSRDLSIIHLASSKGKCPSVEIVNGLRERGLYEPITLLYKRGCSVPEEVVDEAVRFHILMGQASYLEPYGYRPPRPLLASLYCGRSVVELWDGGKTITTRGLPEAAVARIKASIHPESIAALLGAGVLATWACRGGLSSERILGIVFPEMPLSTAALSYHLGIEGSRAEIVGRATSIALQIAGIVDGLDEIGVPQWITNTLSREDSWCGIGRDTVVVTDHPRASCPTWIPKTIDPPSERPEDLPGEAWVALKSLAVRRGDYRRVPHRDPERPWLGKLHEAIQRLLKDSPPPGEGGFQVAPEDARILDPSMYNVVFECSGVVEDCRRRAGLKIEGGLGVKPRVASASPLLRGPLEAVSVARELWGGGPTLYVLPSRLAATISGRELGLYLVSSPRDVDDWIDTGLDAVASWSDLLRMPWLKGIAKRMVLVYPEAYPGKPADPVELEAWISSLASQVSRLMVSRLAYHMGGELVGEERVPATRTVRVSRSEVVDEAERVFMEHWTGYRLRGYQATVVSALVEMMTSRPNQPVYTILPTGSGKSAIFQVAGLIGKRLGLGGYVLVVSPLRALMRDQVENARRHGFSAERIDSTVSGRRKARILSYTRAGAVDILYVTPERFMDEDFNKLLVEAPPTLVVLDEAHTLARWGQSFRPAYLHAAKLLADLRETDAWPPVALFTATAPDDVVEGSLASIGVSTYKTVRLDLDGASDYEYPDEGALVFRGPVVRPELVFTVVPVEEGPKRVDRAARLIRELAEWSSSFREPWVGIVYTGFVKKTSMEWKNADKLAELLGEKTGLSTISYHGQLTGRERRIRENTVYQASSGERDPLVVVATKAFGMGVDIPNIRWVLHFTASDSIEDYYQEAGRAGRDGREARIVTFYNPVDFDERVRMARRQRTTPSSIATTYNTIIRLWHAIRERTGGSPMIVLPTQALHNAILGLKSVSMLQRLGYLDYWSLRGSLAGYKFRRGEEPSDYLPWYMDLGGGVVVGPREKLPGVAEKLPISIARCTRIIDGYRPLTIRVGPVRIETGECSEHVPVELRGAQLVVINLSLDRRHETLEILPPEEFSQVVSAMWSEEEKVRALQDLLESALQASKTSTGMVNEVLRRGLEEYFARPRASLPRDPPAGLLGKRVACPRLSDCVGEIVDAMSLAADWLGGRGVTLAVQDGEMAERIIKRYTSHTGRPFEGAWKGAYERIVAASRTGGIYLMDYGFIVAAARAAPKPSVLIERLRGYPYHALFIYNKA